jgi:hypothetical protein
MRALGTQEYSIFSVSTRVISQRFADTHLRELVTSATISGILSPESSAGLSLVQLVPGTFREPKNYNELSLRFRVGSLTFSSRTFSSVPFVKK